MSAMNTTIPINEIFKSIQGEGRYQGHPVIFIRVSGCTRQCSWCDTPYHVVNNAITVQEITDKIKELGCTTVVWTGGEPLLYLEDIAEVIKNTTFLTHHMETNGDLFNVDSLPLLGLFTYICVSPKEKVVAIKVSEFLVDHPNMADEIDIKVVTDMETVGIDMLEYATILMPLSIYNFETDQSIRQRVWTYCTDHGLFYSGRLHVEIWKQTRGK